MCLIIPIIIGFKAGAVSYLSNIVAKLLRPFSLFFTADGAGQDNIRFLSLWAPEYTGHLFMCILFFFVVLRVLKAAVIA